MVGRGGELDVDRATGRARAQVLVGDVAVVLPGADHARGQVVGAQEVEEVRVAEAPVAAEQPLGQLAHRCGPRSAARARAARFPPGGRGARPWGSSTSGRGLPAAASDMSQSMRILVTGSSGHLGEALMRVPPRRGPRRHRARRPRVAAHHRGRLDRRPRVRAAARRRRGRGHPRGHAAQAARRTRIGRAEFVDTNVTGTLNLLEEAVAASVSRFVFTSTTSTFGRALTPAEAAPAAWITEDVAPVPRNIYGTTKTAAEDLCELIARDHGLPCLILRTSRFFPEPDDRDEVRGAYDDLNLKVNELLLPAGRHRGRGERPPARARARAGDRLRPLRHQRDDAVHPRRPAPRSGTTCRASCDGCSPATRSCTRSGAGGCSPRSSACTSTSAPADELGWSPRYDFGFALDRLARRRRPAQPARAQHRRQGLPRRLDRRLHGALNLDHRAVARSTAAVADRVGRADRLGGAPRARLVAGVHERQRPTAGPDALAERRHLGQADAVVDDVVSRARPPPRPTTAIPTARTSIARRRRPTRPARRRRSPARLAGGASGSSTRSGGPPSSATIAREPLGGGAALKRRRRRGPRGVEIGVQPAEHQQLGAQRERHLAAGARRARRPVRWSIDSRTSTALPAVRPSTWFMSVSSAVVGMPLPPATSTIACASSRASSSSRRNAPRADLDVHDERVEAGGELLGQDRADDQRDRLDRCRSRRGSRTAGGRRARGGRLADDRAADAARPPRAGARSIRRHVIPRDRLELVERAARVAEPASRDHRHERRRRRPRSARAAGSPCRRRRPSSACRAPGRPARRRSSRVRLPSASSRRSAPRARPAVIPRSTIAIASAPDLGVGHRPVGDPEHELLDLLGRQLAAVALAPDQLGGQHRGDELAAAAARGRRRRARRSQRLLVAERLVAHPLGEVGDHRHAPRPAGRSGARRSSPGRSTCRRRRRPASGRRGSRPGSRSSGRVTARYTPSASVTPTCAAARAAPRAAPGRTRRAATGSAARRRRRSGRRAGSRRSG